MDGLEFMCLTLKNNLVINDAIIQMDTGEKSF